MFATTASPVLRGSGRRTYLDGRWLPTNRLLISSSGQEYVYAEGYVNDPNGPEQRRLRRVDIRTGADEIIGGVEPDGVLTLLDFETEGVYFSFSAGPPSAGWLYFRSDTHVGTSSRPDRLLSQTDPSGWYPGDGVFWAAGDGLSRLDLNTGELKPWFKPASGSVRVLALLPDGRTPLIEVVESQTKSELFTVSPDKPGAEHLIGAAPVLLGGGADEHGVWLGGPSSAPGLYLLSKDLSLRRVSADPVVPAGSCA